MSITGTPLFKLVMVLVSKQRGRALVRKSYSYLNRWTDLLFIGVPCGFGCLGDLVRLNSEYPRRVDSFRCTGTVHPIGWRHVSLWSGDGGHEGRLILIQAVGTVSV